LVVADHVGRNAESKEGWFSRRAMLGTGWAAFLTSIVGPWIANVRFLFPNVVYETPTTFKIGYPEDFPDNSATFFDVHRLFILRKGREFRAISAVCTHLRCTVNRDETTDRYLCPCHGSLFDKVGSVLAGPAPRPLEWYRVEKAPDGRLVVNTNAVVAPETTLIV
jgi:Rieske Fe-S protein